MKCSRGAQRGHGAKFPTGSIKGTWWLCRDGRDVTAETEETVTQGANKDQTHKSTENICKADARRVQGAGGG